jgi:hypothetical protein
MTKLREAAQQALDYIRSTTDYKMGHPPACEVAVDLADALADHNEEVLEMVEPVAWMYDTIAQDGSVLKDWVSREHPQESALEEERPHNFRRLYTAPQPRRRLTDEEIDRVTDAQWARNSHKPIYAAHRAYARAIEDAIWSKT